MLRPCCTCRSCVCPRPWPTIPRPPSSDNAPTAQAVFVSLRQPGVPGPPLAAKKLPAGPFPLTFTLTEADRPMAQGPVPDTFEVKVTLDVDGDPMSKSETDLEVVQEAKKGGAPLVLKLAPRS